MEDKEKRSGLKFSNDILAMQDMLKSAKYFGVSFLLSLRGDGHFELVDWNWFIEHSFAYEKNCLACLEKFKEAYPDFRFVVPT